MKLLIVSLVGIIGCVALGLIGLFSNQPSLILPAFCAWTPAVFLFGYSMAGVGVRVNVTTKSKQRPNQNRKVEAF